MLDIISLTRYPKGKRWDRGSACRQQPPCLCLREQGETVETEEAPAEGKLRLLRREGPAWDPAP